ncbi:hypothetical protein vseg_017858 [Gypsophila vaccaria]
MLVILAFLLYLNTSLSLVTQAHPHIVNSLPGYHGLLPFSLQTGYVGVGEAEEVQLFYYFVESERDVGSDPLILWLTGGPGCSAFSGFVFEIGPISFDYAKSNRESDLPTLQLNPYSWTKVASIIFLDSPVGTGFSYARSYEGYYSNDTLQSAYIHQFLVKWFLDHPNFRSNRLYIAGDSYSGMIVPRVVQEILNGNENALVPKMNLKGYALGNPSTIGTRVKNSHIEYGYRESFISDELYQFAKISCNGDFVTVDAKNIKCVQALATISDVTSSISYPHILEPVCPEVTRNPPKEVPIYMHRMGDGLDYSLHLRGHRGDRRPQCRGDNYVLSRIWANHVQVREALNIREGTIDRWVRCNSSLSYTPDFEDTVVEYHKNLSNMNLHVLVYSGDHDFGETYVGTLEWIGELQLPTKEEWRPWFVGGQVAGYATEYGSSANNNYRLIFTTVKGAGHTAPEYKPREGLAMIKRWLESSSL